MLKTRIIARVFLLGVFTARTSFADPGILSFAHGGSPEWNARVTELVANVDTSRPTEVAFGRATRANIQSAFDRLVVRGVTDIVAVPLFVSSWSSVRLVTRVLAMAEQR